MDDLSRRVGEEIIEAGVARISAPFTGTWEAVALGFLGPAKDVSDAFIGNFTRGLSSLQVDEEDAAKTREKVAVDLHRIAVEVVRVGGEVAVMAEVLDGSGEEEEAREKVVAQLRASLSEDEIIPGDSGDELMATTLRNYLFAAAGLHDVNLGRQTVEDFLDSVYSVVGGVLVAASNARGDESLMTEAD